MKTVIYVDELLAVNLFVTYFLILASMRLTGVRASIGRRLLGALAGAAVSLAVFIPAEGFAVTFVVNLLGSFLIVFAAFFPWRLKSFLRLYLAFFTVNFIFAGVMLAVCCVFTPAKMLSRNGVVYFDVDVLLIASLTAICYGGLTIGGYFLKKRTAEGTVSDVTVRRNGRTGSFRALHDTGMNLSDVFSGRPAVIAGLDGVRVLLSDEEYEFFKGGGLTGDVPHSLRRGFRLLSCSTVSGESMLPAFLSDELINGETVTKEVYIAVTPRLNGTGEYNMLVGGELSTERTGKSYGNA